MKTIKNHNLILAYISFAKFIETRNIDKLVIELSNIEKNVKGKANTDKNIWFRFFECGISATTIRNLEHTFKVECTPNSTAYRNKEYELENILIALNNVSLQMYYS